MQWIVLATLLVSGLLGNYFKYPLFFEIDFLFGSIFSFLVLQYFGRGYGIGAALLISGVTYFIWGHPYAVLIMTAELAFAAVVAKRFKVSLVFADACFWVLIGMPMVYFFYHGVMGVAESATTISLTKQAVNGIINVLLARLAFTLIGFRAGGLNITLREVLHMCMVFCVAVPMLILIVIDSRSDFQKRDLQVRSDLARQASSIEKKIQAWIDSRSAVLATLEATARRENPAEMQAALELLLNADPNFFRMGYLNPSFVTQQYAPRVNERGLSNIGVDFSDRPYVPRIKEQAIPMFSEVIAPRLGSVEPIVAYLQPVLKDGQVKGYVSGILSLSQINQFMAGEAASVAMRYSLIDLAGKVIVTNRDDQKPMTPFVWGNGSLNKLDESISQWVPSIRPGAPFYERFRKSFYVREVALGGASQWRLVLEQGVEPIQKALNETYTQRLSLLLFLLLLGTLLAETVSRQIVKTFEILRKTTGNLPAKLASGQTVEWPKSQVVETQTLIANFKSMADSLQVEFAETQAANALLETRVAERTQALEQLNSEFIALLENTTDFIHFKDQQLIWRFCSQPYAKLAGRESWRDLIGKTNQDIFPPELLPTIEAEDQSILRTGKPILDKIDHALYADGKAIWTSVNKWPLFDAQGQVVGLFGIHRDITKQKEANDSVKRLAFYDTLTNLPNRRLLLDRLEQALASFKRSGQPGALIFIDLDHFKNLNDTRGHFTGDLLLQQVAQRLTECVRDEDTVARIGGDEFVVMLQGLGKSANEAAIAARTIGEKILSVLNVAFLLEGQEYISSSSVGVALFEDGVSNVEDLLKRADLAMYQVKASGRNSMLFFDTHMQEVINARTSLEQDLRLGLSHGQLVLYFQPQFRGAEQLMGAEALLRWRHPTLGLVPPIEFIPLAEETQLIIPIGHWVMEQACMQLVTWAQSPTTEHLVLSVNVSARQFNMPNFVEQTQALLVATGARPAKLMLEVTESLLLTDMETIIEKMHALRALGVGFSLDDFGTGYSSLSYLKRMPLNHLKIDKSFVQDINTDINDAAIIQAIISMGRALDIHVIAEGVETAAQRDTLTQLGCELFQGYLFGRPVPIEQFEQAMHSTA